MARMASRASRRVLPASPAPLAAAELLVSCGKHHTASDSSSVDSLRLVASCWCGDVGGADDDDDGNENGITTMGALNIRPI